MLGAPAAVPRRGGRWRLRDWRLRTKLTAVLLVPLLLAVVLGALRISDLVRKAGDSASLARQISFAQRLGLVVHELQGERYRVAAIQAGDRGLDPAELQKQVQRVDAAVTSLRAADMAANAFPAATRTQWEPAHRDVLDRLSGLAALRRAARPPGAVAGDVSSRTAIAAYSELIALLLNLDRQALSGVGDTLADKADAIKALAVAQEEVSWQHAVLQAGILTDGLSTEQQVTLRTAEARFEAAAVEFSQAASPAQRQFYFTAKAVTDRKRLLDAVLDRAVRRAPLDTVPSDWNSAASATVEWIWQGHTTLLSELRRDAGVRGEAALRQAYWDGAIVGILLLLAVALLILVMRSLLQPLRTLRTAAFEVADRRLPQAVEQLRTADGAPAQATVEPVPVHSREEVGQVARAFDTVHAQAVRLAAEQAQLCSCVNEIFLSLSGRSQDLLERALRLIDDARAQAADPELLSLLDQLKCLATRMRRYSENLLAFAGGTQRRGTDVPMAVLEVFHAAVSEIEEGARVSVCPPPAVMVDGPVVTDLIHLIAELLDNATSATPHDASVTLGGSLTDDNGLLVEITDSGVGLSSDALATINARLASAPTLDLMDPPAAGQMGLFVVRELATPHGITVRLRQRTGGSGITATALLPPPLIRIDLPVSAQDVLAQGVLAQGFPAEDAPASSGWDDAQGQLPLQVSVIDQADETDLFSPASINPGWLGAETSPPGRPRTAQEEWLELFGSQNHGVGQNHGVDEPHPDVHAEPLMGIPAAGESHEVREEIFEMVSAWFREQQSTSANDTLPTIQPDWCSPFDEDWQAAQALRHPIDHGLTEAGLPKRHPRAHLVSGVDSQVASMPVSVGPVRSPEDVRNRLSRYQRGLRVGRHARIGPDEPLSWTDTLAQPFGDDYGPSGEDQQ